MNAALAAAADRARALGATSVLAVSCDLPELTPFDLRVLIESAFSKNVVVAPDRHGSGTNAILFTGERSPFQFGLQSLKAHLKTAEAARIEFRVVQRHGLAFDIDTEDDLAAWVGTPSYDRIFSSSSKATLQLNDG